MDDLNATARRGEGTLEGWKEIADHLHRTVRTARRWERSEGLPVHRHVHQARASVYAYPSELDAWIATRQPRSQQDGQAPRFTWRPALALTAALVFPLMAPSSSPLRMAAAGQADAMTERRVWAGPEVSEGSVSMDGRFATFVDWDTGNLAIRNIETGEVRPVTSKGTWAESGAFAEESIFSPDGTQVAYAWCCEGPDDAYGLRVSSLDGAGVRTLLVAPYLEPRDWSADGRSIAALRSSENGPEVTLVNVATGDARVLATLPRGAWPAGVRFSPDGRFLAYDRPPVSDVQAPPDIYVTATGGGGDVRLVDHPAGDMVIDWSPDGSRLLFGSTRSGRLETWALPVNGATPAGPPERLNVSLAAGQIATNGLTADGRLFYRAWNDSREAWVADFDPETGRVQTPSSPVSTVIAGGNSSPAWSPDGSALAFLRRAPGGLKLVLRSLANGSERELEINPDGSGVRVGQGSMRWAPDGSRIVFVGNDALSRQGIQELDLATGQTSSALLAEDDGAIVLRTPQFSPDGRSIYYRRQGPGYHIVRWDLSSGERTVLYSAAADESRDFIALLEVSPDGRRLAFGLSPSTNTSAQELYVMPSGGGEAVRVLAVDPPDSVMLQAFTADGRYLLYTYDRSGSAQPELWRVPAGGGAAERVPTGLGPFFVRVRPPDGRQLAMETREGYGELWAVENVLGAVAGP